MNRFSVGYASFAAALTLVLSSGAAIVTSDTLQIDAPTNWSGVTNIYDSATVPGAVNANLTLDGRSYVRVKGSGLKGKPTDFYFGTNANDVAVVLRGNSGLALSYRDSTSPAAWVAAGVDPAGASLPVLSYITVHAGLPEAAEGSTGRVFFNPQTSVSGIFGGNFLAALWMQYLYVEPSITPGANGMVDLLQLDRGAMSDIGVMFIRHAKPVRILFNGGEYHINNSTRADYSYMFQVPAGKSLILEGVNGWEVFLSKRFSEPFFSDGVSGGDIYIRGRDVRLSSQGSRAKWGSGANYFPFKLRTADHIHWEHTGDLLLASLVWLRCDNDDMLPHGPQTGGLVLVSLAGSGYAPGNANADLGYSCIDLYGTKQRVNSAVSELNSASWHRGYLTNSTPNRVGVLRLGTHDDDGKYNLCSWPGTEVWKEGSGTLSVQSAEGPVFKALGGQVAFSRANGSTLDNIFTNLTVAAGTQLAGEVAVRGALIVDGPGAQAQNALQVNLGEAATLDFANGATSITVAQVRRGGTVLPKGTYTAADYSWIGEGGSLTVLSRGSVAKTATFVWQGGGAPNTAETAANWVTSAPALVSGGEELDFSSGTAAVTFGGVAQVYGMLFNRTDDAVFAMDGERVVLGAGGLTVSGKGVTIENALEVSATPQTWAVNDGASLTVNGAVSSCGASGTLQISSASEDGKVTLAGDNSGLFAPLNVAKVKLTVKSSTALGSALRETRINALKTNLTDTDATTLTVANGTTIATPLDLAGSFGPLTGEKQAVTFAGPVRVTLPDGLTGSQTHCMRLTRNVTHTFTGGLDVRNTYRFFFNGHYGARVKIENKPIVAGTESTGCQDLAIYDINGNSGPDNPFTVELNVSGNEWRTLRIYSGRVVCGAKNALSRLGVFTFGRSDWTSSSLPEKYTLDLGGHDQQVGSITTGWSLVPGAGTYNAARFAAVTSAVPATLTMTPRANYDSSFTNAVIRFRGAAAFRFAPSTFRPQLTLQNFTSDTTGSLEVHSGRLTMKGGAGWIGSTNVTVCGTGELKVDDAASAAVAFGENGAHTVLHLADMGKLSLPAGQTVVTRMLEIDGVRMPKGTYGGAGSGAAVINTDHFTANGGVLRVRFRTDPATMLILR
ncbi:MAG: hypothetical protein MJ240_08260 [Kiritimatiellae bacterium]|nr:hypothetical protein [Kiritimatiellia bacterium]